MAHNSSFYHKPEYLNEIDNNNRKEPKGDEKANFYFYVNAARIK